MIGLALVGFAASAAVSAPPDAPGAAPALNAFLAAANGKAPKVARRFGLPGKGDVFPWLPRTEGPSIRHFFQPEPWKAATLAPPFTNGPRPLAVFHTWHAPESDGDHIHPLVKTRAGWRLDREISERDTQGYRITHHDLRVRLRPAAQSAAFRDAFTVVRSAGAEPVAFIRLSDDFRVSSVRSSGKSVPFRQAGGIIAVRVPRGKSVPLEMEYSGKVSHRLMSSITKDLACLTAYYYPTLGRLPSTADVAAVVPAGWTAITQGELAERRPMGNETLFRWHNTVPVNYFTLDAGPYTETKRTLGDKTLYAYLLKAEPGFADKLLDSVALAMPYYEKRFGPYPYTRYSVVDGGPILGFVALEGYSFASYGTVTLTPFVLAHELSHTYWGGLVANTYLRSWWNEAFASYSDDAFSRMRNNVQQRHPTDRPWWPAWDRVKAAPLSTARDADSVNAIAYDKGKVVLRILEQQVSTPTFDRILQEFVKENRSNPDPGWPDFERTVNRVTGKDWGWFYKDWIDKPGWPQVHLADVRVTPKDGAYEISGKVLQDGAPYRYGLGLRVQFRDGTPSRDLGIKISKASNLFRFTLPAPPERLEIDPTFEMPRRMGLDDVAVFNTNGSATLKHSREEEIPFMGGM